MVTCSIAVHAYYSNYGPNPEIIFRPGMVGRVRSVAPKVRIVKGPGNDGKRDFLVVDFWCPLTGRTECVGLNFCNAKACQNHATPNQRKTRKHR